MYTLYIANKNYSSWSLRPWILMRELQIPFEERIAVFEQGSNWDSFRKFSPAGRVPCLHDDATVVWDSLAITEYLAERHPAVWPAERSARTWARCAAAEMHSGFAVLRQTCPMNCGIRVRLNEIPAALETDLRRIGELWAEGLRRFGGPFLAASAPTAVDAFFAPVAFRIQTYGLPMPEAAAAWAGRMLERPSMREWYEAALKEPWREEAHELEARTFGAVIADLRTA
jgi:glutathione S-transferase